MKPERFKGHVLKWLLIVTAEVILLAVISPGVSAQELPPRPPVLTLIRDLSFGAFYGGSAGGTITISSSGVRTSTGDILLLGLGFPYVAAQFNINSNPGTVISILNGPDVFLTYGTYSMKLHIGASNPTSPFVNSNPFTVPTQLTVGATLNVGTPAANPPGNYSGTFMITIVLE